MKKNRLLSYALLAVGFTAVHVAYAAVWKADLQVGISASKNTTAQQITYTITVKNLADDDARDTLISHTPSYQDGLNNMTIASVTAQAATCTHALINNSVLSVKCTLAQLGVGATETITVVVNNPGNGARTGAAQAMGISPDPNPSNNFASITVP